MNIKQQIACINRLPGVRLSLISDAKIIALKIKEEEERHRLAMIDLESEWNRDVWRSVEKEWSNEEVVAALTAASGTCKQHCVHNWIVSGIHSGMWVCTICGLARNLGQLHAPQLLPECTCV